MSFIIQHKILLITLLSLLLVKVIWVIWSCWGNGLFDKEKNELLQRRNYLVEKVVVEPCQLLDEKTGLLVSFLDDNEKTSVPIKGSYSALNCYYLTKIDPEFACE